MHQLSHDRIGEQLVERRLARSDKSRAPYRAHVEGNQTLRPCWMGRYRCVGIVAGAVLPPDCGGLQLEPFLTKTPSSAAAAGGSCMGSTTRASPCGSSNASKSSPIAPATRATTQAASTSRPKPRFSMAHQAAVAVRATPGGAASATMAKHEPRPTTELT